MTDTIYLLPKATDVAQRCWSQATAQASSTEEVLVAVERLCADLRTGLVPWVGGEGFRALLDRAIGEVELEHPALGGLSFLGGDEPTSTATSVDERAREFDHVAVVTMALIVALINAFGRIVGDTLALRLVDQISIAGESRTLTAGPTGVKSV